MWKTAIKIWKHDFFGFVSAMGILTVVSSFIYLITGKGSWMVILAGAWTLGMLFGRSITLKEVRSKIPPFSISKGDW